MSFSVAMQYFRLSPTGPGGYIDQLDLSAHQYILQPLRVKSASRFSSYSARESLSPGWDDNNLRHNLSARSRVKTHTASDYLTVSVLTGGTQVSTAPERKVVFM